HESDWIEQSLIRQGPACFWVLNAAGRILFVSGNAEPVFGKSAAQWRNRLIEQVLPAAELTRWRGRIDDTIAKGHSLRRERIGDKLWGVVCYPLRNPGSGETVAA